MFVFQKAKQFVYNTFCEFQNIFHEKYVIRESLKSENLWIQRISEFRESLNWGWKFFVPLQTLFPCLKIVIFSRIAPNIKRLKNFLYRTKRYFILWKSSFSVASPPWNFKICFRFIKNDQRSGDFTLSKSIISSTSPPWKSWKFLLHSKPTFLLWKLQFLVGSPPKKRRTATIFPSWKSWFFIKSPP